MIAISWVDGVHIFSRQRQIVERLQHEVFESFFHRGKQYDEGELLEDVKDFADKHELIGHRIRRRHKVVPLKSALQSGVVSVMDPDTESEEIDDVEVEKGKVLAFVQDAEKQDDGDVISSGVQGKYFITVSRRTGFRRLHVVGSCHVKAERCQQVVDVDSLEGQNFDAICKFCKRGLKQLTGDEVEESSSSSTGDSTSTCTDTDVELGISPCLVRISFRFSGIRHLVRAMAAGTDADRRSYIAQHVSADLQYVWQDNEVSLQNQYLLAQHYKSLKVFSTFCDTKAEVRTALRDDFRIDQAADAATRAEVARIVTSWEVSRELASKEQELRAEAKVFRVLKLEGIAWLCVAAKFKHKHWLHGLTLADWTKYTDYILGDRVNNMKIQVDGQNQSIHPPWSVILTYEHRLRKEAFKLVQSGEKSLSKALADVVKNADLKESYFTTPIALGAQQNCGNKWRRLGDGKGKNDFKGDWKGDRKGKKGKKGDGKQSGGKDHHGNPLASKTPDGREICYAFNSQGCRGRCGRVHVCRADVKQCLKKLALKHHFELEIREVDIERSSDDDLTKSQLWDELLEQIRSGHFDVVFMSPPCNTWSRVRFQWQQFPGPRPVRNAAWPMGFPWLSAKQKEIVEFANYFVRQTIQACYAAASRTKFLVEHPEGLGAVGRERPASVWQLDEMRQMVLDANATTWAVFQCQYGGLTPKPTRFVSNIRDAKKAKYNKWPSFSKDGQYLGPLPYSCGHRWHVKKLIGKSKDGRFQTGPSAAYPAGLCMFLAQLIASVLRNGGGELQSCQDEKIDIQKEQFSDTKVDIQQCEIQHEKFSEKQVEMQQEQKDSVMEQVEHIFPPAPPQSTTTFEINDQLPYPGPQDTAGVIREVHESREVGVKIGGCLRALGTPFACKKFSGGIDAQFVGYKLDYKMVALGINAKRGAWLLEFLASLKKDKFTVHMRRFAEFLGRPLVIEGDLFRTDAKCETGKVTFGGYHLGDGRWFSLSASPSEAPYLFKANGDSQWASAPSELLAVMIALQVYGFLEDSAERKQFDLMVQGGTDNRSIEQMTRKAATTRWPLVLVNMQLTDSMMRSGMRVGLKWRPRDENTVADDLTNEKFDQVDIAKRVQIRWNEIKLDLLNKLWGAREDFLDRDSWVFFDGVEKSAPFEKTSWG
eukprot:symbB.v1.2.011607.t2/scaffold783.1/size170700/1